MYISLKGIMKDLPEQHIFVVYIHVLLIDDDDDDDVDNYYTAHAKLCSRYRLAQKNHPTQYAYPKTVKLWTGCSLLFLICNHTYKSTTILPRQRAGRSF